LALFYDRLVDGVDFAGWADYVEQILAHFHHGAASVVDLACGTGNTALPLAARGYRVTGVDISAAMLAVAGEKARRLGLSIELVRADMRLFSVPAPVDLVTCFHDGLNYLPGTGDLVRTFTRVRLALNPGGLFIFDLNAIDWLADLAAGDDEMSLSGEDFDLTWRTGYDRADRSWECDLRGWVLQDGARVAVAERHREWAHPAREVATALAAAGLSQLAVYHPFTLQPATPASGGSRRHFYVARKGCST